MSRCSYRNLFDNSEKPGEGNTSRLLGDFFVRINSLDRWADFSTYS